MLVNPWGIALNPVKSLIGVNNLNFGQNRWLSAKKTMPAAVSGVAASFLKQKLFCSSTPGHVYLL